MSLCCAIPFGNSRQTVSKGRSKPRGDPSRPKGGEGTNRCCALSPQHMVFRGPSLPQQVRDLSGASDSRASDFAGAWVPYGAGPFSSHCIPTHLLLPMGPAGRQATPPRGRSCPGPLDRRVWWSCRRTGCRRARAAVRDCCKVTYLVV